MKFFRKKRLVVALINRNGRVIKKPIRCPKCNRKVDFINRETVHCKNCGALDIGDLVKTFLAEPSPNLSFIETN